MNVRKLVAGTTAAAALTFGAVTPVAAQTQTQRAENVGGLVVAVVQAQVNDVEVNVVRGDVNVTLTNVLNNNRVLTNFLNNNDIDVVVTDVVDVTIEDNVLVINVLSSSTLAPLALL